MTVGTIHPFSRAPHRTFWGLSVPVLGSLVAEPLTGLVDTAFVARLGVEPLAALGIGAILLSSVFWIFNFLGIATQTEVARAIGGAAPAHASRFTGSALTGSGLFGGALILAGWAVAPRVVASMGADDKVGGLAMAYLHIRLLGAPAVLATVTCFGALRGLQDMRTPLWVAIAVNGLNIGLDGLLIFGPGPLPALGIEGAAWASTVSQWLGAGWALRGVWRRLGPPARGSAGDASRLFRAGADLFIRTGLLSLFLILTTRAANRIGADAGAAHQAVRQVWIFNALFLDAFAITGQSLVAYFLGAGELRPARRVAAIVCGWSVAMGVGLGWVMWIGTDDVARWLAPGEARGWFLSTWWLAAASQPVNGLSFGTDGIHWGAGDFRYLRNGVVLASGVGLVLLQAVDLSAPDALRQVWLCTAGWIGIRAVWGLGRIWPGWGRAPLGEQGRGDRGFLAGS